ncbi:hypothetical protein D7D52_35795 [Nocardia yunnanensis]|uniref:DUF4352 domain-containing protein n=1 Tax=Nocardia yunnanensis TaxID=2382165 RepID=A0A386ZM98_9NOCA|nr:hypothetical protein [Nocardia yunnanensis]AYF78304.1 hypothetical protein D7D52_35795 [Nocardia yunnanensis]
MLIVGLALTACDSSDSSTAKVTTSVPLTPLDQSVTVADKDGVSAKYTLNTYRLTPDMTGLGHKIVLDVTVTDTSSAPFEYDEDNFVWTYPPCGPIKAGDLLPLLGGAMLNENYTSFMPPQPLRIGTLQPGESANGLVIMQAGGQGPYCLYIDLDNHFSTPWELPQQ